MPEHPDTLIWVAGVKPALDLYGPTFYPDVLKKSKERYDWAKKDIEHKVNQPKFFQFFCSSRSRGMAFK